MHSVIAAAVAEADACISSASAPDFSHLQRQAYTWDALQACNVPHYLQEQGLVAAG